VENIKVFPSIEEMMKIASVLLLLILLLGIFLSPPRGEEVEEGYTHFT